MTGRERGRRREDKERRGDRERVWFYGVDWTGDGIDERAGVCSVAGGSGW